MGPPRRGAQAAPPQPLGPRRRRGRAARAGRTEEVPLKELRGRGATSSALGDDEIGVGLLLADNAGAVRVQSCRFEGAPGYGDGLSGVGGCCWLPNHTGGWDAVRVVSSAGGAGGQATDGVTPPGPPGQPLDALGPVYTFAVEAITLETAPILRANTALRLDVRGTPGALAHAFLGDAPTFEPRPSWRGVLTVAARVPRESRLLGAIPASGLLTVDVTLPALAPGVLERALHAQVARTDGAGGHVLGEPIVVTRLAAGL